MVFFFILVLKYLVVCFVFFFIYVKGVEYFEVRLLLRRVVSLLIFYWISGEKVLDS